MSLVLDLQVAADARPLPTERMLSHWAESALRGRRERAELTIRLVDEEEGRALNREFRGRDYATNVLSFPCDAPAVVGSDLLGDLVICAPVVAREALVQGKEAMAHWAHLVVHGVLHLLGYDHQTESQALAMERIETSILSELGFADPYRESPAHG